MKRYLFGIITGLAAVWGWKQLIEIDALLTEMVEVSDAANAMRIPLNAQYGKRYYCPDCEMYHWRGSVLDHLSTYGKRYYCPDCEMYH